MYGKWLIATATLLACGCLDVADERARIDARVGQADGDAGSVRVAGGLAAIRGLSAGRLHLWASAPGLDITLDPESGSPSTWRVRIENTMPDATLVGAVDGVPLEVTLTDSPVATERTWRVELPAGTESASLQLRVPDAGETGAYRYAVFADVQEAIDDVQDIYARMNADASIRFVLMSGDLTSQGEEAELERFQRELKELRVPVFSTLGNHELGASEGNYHRYFGRGSRHFAFRGAHFTLLDDASATLAPQVYGWLDDWLAEGDDAFHSVYMHIPPLDASGIRNGAFASRAEANMLLGRLARAGVDLTVYGHVHSFYAYSNAGIPAFITGGGGAIPEQLDRIGRHFVTVDVDPATQLLQTAIVHVD